MLSWRKGLLGWSACITLILALNALKFVQLSADFPSGITQSRVLYTDEGWYSTDAVSRAMGGSWYAAGELNTIVNLPVGPLLQAVVFRLFGVGLVSARALVAAFSLILVAGAFLLARRIASVGVAAILALLLSADFFLFSYSRLATLDLIAAALTVVALSVAARVTRDRDVLLSVLSGALMSIAGLTKTTALCALPALGYLCATSAAHRSRRWLLWSCSVGVCVLTVSSYSISAWSFFPLDFQAFQETAVGFDLASHPIEMVRNALAGSFTSARELGFASLVAIGLTLLLMRWSSAFRTNVLVRASLLWILGFLAMLSLVSYHPSRYLTMIVVPTLALISVAIVNLRTVVADRRAVLLLQQTIVGALVTVNGIEITAYLAQRQFSFETMAREVAAIVKAGTLVGDMSSTMTLATGVRSMGLTTGTIDLASRLRQRCPTHYITLQQPEAAEVGSLLENYRLEHLQDWNVFDNYYLGRRVQLYRLIPQGELSSLCRHGF